MKKLSLRLFIFCFACVGSILFFELIFRALYWGSQSFYLKSNPTSNHKETILCVGNSFTLGVGAPRGESYPDHLQKLLRENPLTLKYQVVNLGRGAFNTSLILENLEKWLTDYRPQFVLFQVGEPNGWNRYGHDRFLGINSHPLKRFIEKHSAIYRYFNYVSNMKRTQTNESDGDFNFRNEKVILEDELGPSYQLAKDLSMSCFTSDWEIQAKKNLKVSKEYLNLSLHIAQAEIILKKFPQSPAASRVLYHLTLSCKNDFPATLPYLEKLITLEPEKKLVHFMNTLTTLNSPNYPKERKGPDRKQYLEYIRKGHPAYLSILKEDIPPRIDDWIRSDLEQMITLTKKAGAQIVLLNYPPRPSGTPREVDQLLRSYALEHNIVFVDIEKYFNQLWKDGRYKRSELHEIQMGVPVEHLNGMGYKMLSEEVYREMTKLKLL